MHKWNKSINQPIILAVAARIYGFAATLGNLQDDSALRISVGMRLGADLCEEHVCRCGAAVDRKGHRSF